MIEVVGIGLDGIAGLTKSVREIVDHATLLVGSDRHLSYFPSHRAKRIILGNFLEAIQEIRQDLENNQQVVILVSGDPLFFGLGRLLLEQIPAEQLQFHPHLCSLQLAFNRLKIPWQDAKIISVHGRDLEALTPLLQQGNEKIAILTDNQNSPTAIARFYLSLDLPTHYNFYICENLAASQEQISYFSAAEVNQLAAITESSFSALNIVILLRQDYLQEQVLDLDTLPLIGLPDRTFLSFSDRPGLMTKREVRLLVLGELSLQTEQIIWDIGAGIGSVAIEIARLCPNSQIYAIEKTAIGAILINKNCQRLQVSNVISLQGNAPEILTNLPNPHRIFIGGTGGKLTQILDICEKKLEKDGVLVLALATLEHLNSSLSWLRDRHWHYRLLQVQISRSVPIAELTRFSPLNPVTLIRATRQHI